jgi:small subunit ribosomal protein S3
MTKIVNPYSYRLGVIRDWRSNWITKGKIKGKDFIKNLTGDVLVREYLVKKLRGKMIGEIIMERNQKFWKITIPSARPGLILGQKGEGVVELKKATEKFMKQHKIVAPGELKIEITEVAQAESNARIVGMMVAEGLEKRLPFRRVLKSTVEKVIANKDVMGIKISLGGRLGGADMARTEFLKKGNIPLQTLRADIDFAREKAHMTYGVLGIKVWIYKGQIFSKKKLAKGNI